MDCGSFVHMITFRNKWVVAVSVILLIGGFLALLDQYRRIGIWFQLGDIHHETIALSLFFLGIGVLAGAFFSCRK
jgi:hypothetical protein